MMKGKPTPRLQAAAVVVPMAALALLMPPFISLFAAPVSVLGIPILVLYMLGVWALLIFLTWRLARRLAASEGTAPPD
jgi:hypothetical protein